MRLLRPAAALTALGLVCAGAVTLAPAATAATTTDTSTLAAYLTAQLVDGDHYAPFDPAFPDVGLTVDGALALAATGSAADTATVGRIADYLDSTVGRDYYEYEGDPQYLGVGYVGKVALLAEVAHRDPRDFAGDNLIDLINDNVCTAATVAADPDNCPAVGAYFASPSVFKQALPIIATGRVGDVSATAVTYLRSLQNADGSWPSLIPPGASPDSDPDSTALALQALATLPDSDGSIAPAIASGVAFLAGSQHADGSWGPSYNPASVNSTGLVLQVLQSNRAVAQTHAARITKGLTFLAGLQNRNGGLPVNDDAGQADSDVRASTQALGGILGVPFGTLSASTPVARTATTDPAAAKAAAWAVSQLTSGDHAEQVFVTPNQPTVSYVLAGQSIDLAYGLLATGGQDVTLGKLLDYASLDTSLRSNVNGENFGDTGSVYIGPTAKLATVLQLAGRDARDVGVDHLDLIAATVAAIGTDGRVHDTTPVFGTDYANVFGQAFTVLALTAAGDTADADRARTGLLAAQCDDGGFPVSFPAAGGACASSPDSTGLAVQALDAAHPTGGATAPAGSTPSAALTRAVDWLTTNQLADGSYVGAPGTTNSTAYAALGLLAVGQAATKPRAHLTGIAQADGGLPVDARGASDFFATAQSLNALAGASFLQLTPTVLTAASTIVGSDPPPTTTPPTTPPPTTTPPTTTAPPVPPTGTASGISTTSPTAGASGQGGGTSLGDGSLPDTGADILTPLWIAVLALALGAAATTFGLRRPRAAGHAARRHW